MRNKRTICIFLCLLLLALSAFSSHLQTVQAQEPAPEPTPCTDFGCYEPPYTAVTVTNLHATTPAPHSSFFLGAIILLIATMTGTKRFQK